MPSLQRHASTPSALLDPHRPIRFRWRGRTVHVHGLLERAALPCLMLMVGDGPPRRFRAWLPTDTREIVVAAAREWLNALATRVPSRRKRAS